MITEQQKRAGSLNTKETSGRIVIRWMSGSSGKERMGANYLGPHRNRKWQGSMTHGNPCLAGFLGQ